MLKDNSYNGKFNLPITWVIVKDSYFTGNVYAVMGRNTRKQIKAALRNQWEDDGFTYDYMTNYDAWRCGIIAMSDLAPTGRLKG